VAEPQGTLFSSFTEDEPSAVTRPGTSPADRDVYRAQASGKARRVIWDPDQNTRPTPRRVGLLSATLRQLPLFADLPSISSEAAILDKNRREIPSRSISVLRSPEPIRGRLLFNSRSVFKCRGS